MHAPRRKRGGESRVHYVLERGGDKNLRDGLRNDDDDDITATSTSTSTAVAVAASR